MLNALIISLIALALLALNFIPRRFVLWSEQIFKKIAARKKLMFVAIPAGSLVLNVMICLRNGIPVPHVQDEFSYLLAADTFCHARLTNPTPKFWQHFETPHELMQPTYMSKYPPAQGLALAAGTALVNMPIFGVWLSTALACMLIYWMLLGFNNPSWALFGAVIAVLHPTLIHWSQVYWGGSVAVIGSALVVGAWIRLLKQINLGPSIFLGLGLIILANSRPYEGLLVAVPVLISLLFKKRLNLRILTTLTVILLPALCWMGYYNFRITGHVFRMPFIEYSRQYDLYPKFWFMPIRKAPAYLNDSMRLIHTVFEQGDFNQLRTIEGLIRISIQRLWMLVTEAGGPLLLCAPLVLGIFSRGTNRWILATIAFFLPGLWAENFFLPHYAAPILPCLLILIVSGWPRLGRLTCRALAIGFFIAALMFAFKPVDRDSSRLGQDDLINQTAQLQVGRHLILVEYTPDHLMHDEWVYNSADIENQPIIWARAMGPAMDKPFINYYSGRQVWKLTVSGQTLVLNPYPEEAESRHN